MFRHFHDFLKKNAIRYFGGILILLLVDVLQLIVPQILKAYTNRVVQADITRLEIWHFGLVILLIAVGIAISRFLWRVLIVWTALNFETWIRSKLFGHLSTMPREYYQKNKTGDLMAHATNDIGTIRQAFSGGIIFSVDALFLTVTTLVIMVSTISLPLTLLAMVPMPFIAIAVIYLGRIVHHKFRLVQEGFSLLSDKVQESFAGIRVIKSFAQEDNDLQDFNKKNQINFDRNMSLARTQSFLQPLVTFIGAFSGILGVVLGTRYVLDGKITLGDFVAFVNYLDMLIWPMIAFGFFTNLIQRGAASIERINRLFDEKSNLHDNPTKTAPPDYSIEFSDLTFYYPDESEPALRDISVYVPSGSSLGILGRTGSGKTTLTSLLQRLYNIPRGSIKIGGVDINDISIHDTRELVGSVPQDLFLFSTKIKNNIALASDEVDMERVLESSEIAQIHSEIMDFPDGYDTWLGERGVNLSGGQKQRSSIARLLYQSPPILIFDDALSAVDTRTEAKILQHIEEIAQEHTTVVISHRVSTLHKLDQIIVLEDGRIIERGTHEELMEREGFYHSIYIKQQLEDKLRGADHASS